MKFSLLCCLVSPVCSSHGRVSFWVPVGVFIFPPTAA